MTGWALVGAVLVASLTTPLAEAFTDGLLADLTTFTFALAAFVLVYAGLFARNRRARARLADASTRNPIRGAVDLSLLLSMWLVALSGFPLLYFARWLRTLDAYWFFAGWHVVTSAILLALVVVHATFNVAPLRSHAR